MRKFLLPLLVLTPLSISAAAHPVDKFASIAIIHHDYVTAEARLNDVLRGDPGNPDALINLAHVYQQTMRPEQASGAYRELLRQVDSYVVRADTGDIVSTHDVATAGLERLRAPRTIIAAR